MIFSASSLTIGAEAVWLECEEICIPGGATVSLAIPVSSTGLATTDSRWVDGFARTRASLPRDDIALDATYSFADGNLNLLVQATDPIFEDARNITFIPDTHRMVDYIAEQDITSQMSSMQLSQKAHSRALREPPARLGGLLLVEDQVG